MKKNILNAILNAINNAETTATTTTTTKTTVMLDGKPTTTTSTTTATTTTRTRIQQPEAPKQPTLIKKLIPAVGWTNPFTNPLELRDEPYKLITSNFRKEESGSYMMSVIREYPDGRQERQQEEGYDIKMFKHNLENSIERLKEDIALRGWEHILFADNHSRRWFYYLTTEAISDPEVQQLLKWFNHQIRNINAFYEGIERRLNNVRDETIADLADNDNEIVANIAADLDEVKADRDNLREENASLEANLDEAERDLETTQTDLAEAEETIEDLNKEIAELKYQLSCAHTREEKQSERMADIEVSLFRLAEDLGYEKDCKHTNAEPLIEVLRKHLIK